MRGVNFGLGLSGQSKYRSLEEQVQDLATNNLLSLWLDFSDLSSLYLDDQEVGGNISSDGETVGRILDKAQMNGMTASEFIASQTELLSTGTTGLVGTATAATYDTETGAGTVSRTTFPTDQSYVEFPVTIGRKYRLDAITGAGGIAVRGTTSGAPLANLGATRSAYYIVATTSSLFFTAGINNTVPFTIYSLKEVPGNHFVQSDASKEPEFNRLLKANADLSGQPNRITNGEFDADSDWTKGTGWSIGSGVATKAAGGTDTLRQNFGATTGTLYAVTFTVSGRTAGTVKPVIGGDSNGVLRSTNGTFTEVLAGGTNALVYFQPDASFDGSVDDVSVKEVPDTQLVNVLTFDGVDDTVGVVTTDLPSDCSLFFAIKTTDSQAIFLNDTVGASSQIAAIWQDGDTSSPMHYDSGSPTYHVDDGAALANRDTFHAAIADGNWHTLEIKNMDFSLWGGLYIGSYGGANQFGGSIIGPIGLETGDLTEARRQTILGLLRQEAGL